MFRKKIVVFFLYFIIIFLINSVQVMRLFNINALIRYIIPQVKYISQHTIIEKIFQVIINLFIIFNKERERCIRKMNLLFSNRYTQ
jgi:hypothetical protein